MFVYRVYTLCLIRKCDLPSCFTFLLSISHKKSIRRCPSLVCETCTFVSTTESTRKNNTHTHTHILDFFFWSASVWLNFAAARKVKNRQRKNERKYKHISHALVYEVRRAKPTHWISYEKLYTISLWQVLFLCIIV